MELVPFISWMHQFHPQPRGSLIQRWAEPPCPPPYLLMSSSSTRAFTIASSPDSSLPYFVLSLQVSTLASTSGL